jgi:hypothetical protein
MASTSGARAHDGIDHLLTYDQFPELTSLSSGQQQVLVRLLRGERVRRLGAICS